MRLILYDIHFLCTQFHTSSNRNFILIFSLKRQHMQATRATLTCIYKKCQCANMHLVCSTRTIHQPFFSFFFHSKPVQFVLFLSFLLNIYMCIYSYTDLINSHNIFTIIDNLHCSSAFFCFFFVFHSMPVLLVLFCLFFYIFIHTYTITLTQQILIIFL